MRSSRRNDRASFSSHWWSQAACFSSRWGSSLNQRSNTHDELSSPLDPQSGCCGRSRRRCAYSSLLHPSQATSSTTLYSNQQVSSAQRPNKRLKLPGGDRLKGSGVFAPCRARTDVIRSEEHTSELQSHSDLVCRLL